MLWMKRFVYSFVGLLLLAVLAVPILRWWVLGTESGTNFALSQARVAGLTIGSHQGTLGDSLRLSDISYQTPGIAIDVQQLQLAVKLNLLPWPDLQIRRLQINNVNLQLSESPDNPETKQSSVIPKLTSPIAVQLENLQINQVSLTTGSDTQPILIDSVQAKLSYFERLDLQQLLINAGGTSIHVSGDSELELPFRHNLKLMLDHQDSVWVPELQGLTADMHSQGSLQELTLQASTSGILSVGLEATLQNLLSNPTWQLSLHNLDSELLWPAGDSDAANLAISDLLLTSSGELNDHNTQLNAVLSYPEAIRGEWRVTVAGDLEQLIVEQFSGPVLQGRISGSGEYRLQSETTNARLAIQLQDIKPDLTQPELAGLPGVSGTLEAHLADRLMTLDKFNLRVPGTDWRINGKGDYSLQDQQLDTLISWQQLSWPPQSGSSAQFTSRQGQLQANGTLTDLAVTLNTELAGKDIPSAGLALNGRLGETEFKLQELVLQTLAGQMMINGQLGWHTGLDWDVGITAEQINPGLHWPDFPGVINLQATSNGSQTKDQLNAVLNIQQLAGSLRGQPVSGNGQLQYVDGNLRTDGLQIRSGDAQLDLQGSEQALQADISIPELRNLLPNASGALQANINGKSINGAALSSENIALRVDLSGTQLSWSDIRVETLALNGEVSGIADELIADMSLSINNLRLPDQAPITLLTGQLTSDDKQQQLELHASHPEAKLDLRLAGNWDQWPLPGSWHGSVEQLSIDNQLTGPWLLRQPAILNVAANDISLQQLCLDGPNGRNNNHPGLCVDYQQQDVNQASMNLHDLPLELAEAWLQTGLRSDHLLSGNIQAGWSEQLERLEGELQLSTGEIRFLDSDTPPLQLNGGNLSLLLEQDQQLHTRLQLTVENSNTIKGDIRYGPMDASEQQLSGTIILDMPKLDWLQKPLPELDRIAGELHLLATLSGPVRQPLIALDINLQNSEIHYQPLGLQLKNLQLAGQSKPGEMLELSGGFSAGQGHAELKGSLHPGTRMAELTISGEQLQLFDSEAIKVKVSPNLKLNASPQGYQINGELQIPSAMIKPPKGSTSRVTESEDVVMVGISKPEQQELEPVPITGQLSLTLGDEVAIDADIVETHLTGTLDLIWDNQSMPEVDGEITLQDGRVQFFGQNLTLEDSRIVYKDAPADNPRLDIRAVRKIFGDPQVEQAGVAVTGLAQGPTVRVYTSPATNEESALAYIATGSNFDHANGQGALNLGIYLFPKLFVSYGLGLFDNGNTANARYEFSEHWNVSVESGSRDTGVDINWRKDG